MNAQNRRTPSRRTYAVRRAVALVILLAVLAALGWGVAALASRGRTAPSAASTASTSQKKVNSSSSTSGTFRSQKAKDSGIPDCSANDMSVTLSADQSQIYGGGTLNLTKKFEHKGSMDCLVDTSDASMVVVISNSQGVQVWRSDACPAEASSILLGQNDTYEKTTAWNGVISNTAVDDSISSRATVNTGGHGCMNAGEQAPYAQSGDYTAQLVDVNDDSVKSDLVHFSIG
ncbi:hypothetical protein [Alloscardovia macacae]|uniref:Peptide ABC transporter permease n=1 Tax=Alloscardovia macacae TaxID=1160091 RepID=A0A261F770_9BIFI|nr:hypothetical protein [Alloscardovia macacae]OZG54934.1 hypothetical protein ALMA_0259 [Alloscardovia macacae]